MPIALNYYIADAEDSDALTSNRTYLLTQVRDGLFTKNEPRFKALGVGEADLELYAPSDLKTEPVGTLPERANKSIEKVQALKLFHTVAKIWGKEFDNDLIHLVVRVKPAAAARLRVQANGQASVADRIKSETEMQELVNEFLESHNAKLRAYLAGRPWTDFWEAQSPVDDEIAHFIKDLKIPKINGKPVLLLHDLGENLVDKTVVEHLFNGGNRVFVNTSGSGKTRLLLEGLSRHWGFYFTAAFKGPSDVVGSGDLVSLTSDKALTNEFILEPLLQRASLVDSVYNRNHAIAVRRMDEVVNARALVFEYFLRTIGEMFSLQCAKDFKMHWLFLQLRPSDILGSDVFADLTGMLEDAPDSYLMWSKRGLGAGSSSLRSKLSLDNDFFVVLDEAQVLSKKFTSSFRSEKSDPAVHRPVLRPIIASLTAMLPFPIIVTGTGMSITLVNSVISSAVLKPAVFTEERRTGGFDDVERQRGYIRRYMPKRILESDSGQALLERAWKWVRGRHRFTAALLDELLLSSFQVPHRTLTAYVKEASGFTPTDDKPFVTGEREDILALPKPLMPLPHANEFTNERINLFRNFLTSWIMLQEFREGIVKNEVEIGFARFSEIDNDAIIDEPLAILAVATAFNVAKGYDLRRHITNIIASPEGRGLNFEVFIGYYLASAFSDGTQLDSIFDFGEITPQWAKQEVKLVSVSRKDGQVNAFPYHLPSGKGGTLHIGKRCESVEATRKWIEDPSSLLCFPDKMMGPDIVLFLLLESGRILSVVFQIKWKGAKKFTIGDQAKAFWSLGRDSLKQAHGLMFWNHNVKNESYKAAQTSFMTVIKEYNGLKKNVDMNSEKDADMKAWLETEVPLLKVLVSHPAHPVERIHEPHVFLNMDRCLRLVDKDNVIRMAVGDSGNTLNQDDASEPPTKKRRSS